VRLPELWSSTSLAFTRCSHHRSGELCLDNAFVLIEGHPENLLPRRGRATRPFHHLTEAPRFWQARFYDFNVYSAKKRREKLEYMHHNPVTRRLVEDPKDWIWSSYASYSRRGTPLLEIDFVD